MASRSIASLSLSFGLVSIPVKVYSATESSAAVRFKLLSSGGQRVRRQYVADDAETPAQREEDEEIEAPEAAQAPSRVASRPAPAAPARSSISPELTEAQPQRDLEATWREAAAAAPARAAALAADEIVKGYEFEKGRFVTFTAAELKELAEASRSTIDIVSFIPEGSVDPIYFDKAYYLAPDKPDNKPYGLLHAALRASGRCALAKWAWRAKEYVVQIRPAGAGLVLQQLLYAEEVRGIDDLGIELAPVGDAELALALRLIEQISDDGYDPRQFVDEERQRILAAVERKIAGRKVVARPAVAAPSAQVIDLVAALRASLGALAPASSEKAAPTRARGGPAQASPARGGVAAPLDPRERKPARRAAPTPPSAAAPAKRSRSRQSGR